MKPLKEKVSITIDSDVLEIIRNAAENDDRSLSQYINLVLKNHCKQTVGTVTTKERILPSIKTAELSSD